MSLEQTEQPTRRPAARVPFRVPAPAPRPVAGSAGARHGLAVVFAVAWLACPLVEPLPSGDVHYPLWQLPIELAAFGAIVVAVVALWRGSRHAARLGMAAGIGMAVMTMVCPLAGHTPVGWWTWVQAGLSLFVLFTSAALPRLGWAEARP
ncbi:UNVERIFIED_ORG: hypothetical protein E4P37_05475 [Bacillus sp. AZ43]